MEEKMKTMTRKERKNYMKKMQLEADLRAIEEKTATMGRWCGQLGTACGLKFQGASLNLSAQRRPELGDC